MKKPLTLRHEKYKKDLVGIIERSGEARLVRNRYKLLMQVLTEEYPSLSGNYSLESLDQIVQDIVYLDRKIRHLTENYDKENKLILSQGYKISEGYGGNIEIKI